jgi:inosose dehydratase
MKRVLISLVAGFLAVTSQVAMSQQQSPGPQPAPETGEKFKIGMAGYTFLKFDIDKTLETMQRLDVHYLCIKDFHLPLASTDEQIAAFLAKLK